MRKQQIAIVNKAKALEMSVEQIRVLSREDITIKLLHFVFEYFVTQNKYEIDKTHSSTEANFWLNFTNKQNKENRMNTDQLGVFILKVLPSTRGQKDTLIGNKIKLRLWRAYKYAEAMIDKHNLVPSDAYTMLIVYSDLLYANVDHKLIKTLIRAATKNFINPHDILYAMVGYPELIEDYKTNGEDSLLYLLIKKSIINLFAPRANELSKLYDNENKRFVFKNEEFDQFFTIEDKFIGYFEVDKYGIAQRNKNKFPIVKCISQFCNKKKMTKHGRDHAALSEWSIWQLQDQSELVKLHQCVEILGKAITVQSAAWMLSVRINTDFFTNIVYNEYANICVSPHTLNDSGWYTTRPTYTAKLTITPDGHIFRTQTEKANTKLIPLTLKEFIYLNKKNNLFGELLQHIFAFHSKSNMFFQDILKDCEVCGCILPVSYNDLFDYYNKKHFLQDKYKKSNEINVNWNKLNINLAYLIIKAHTWVEHGTSQEILSQQKDISLIPSAPFVKGLCEKIESFLVNVIYNNIMIGEQKCRHQKSSVFSKKQRELTDCVETELLDGEMSDWVKDKVFSEYNSQDIRRSILDYIHMKRQNKQKIRLDIKSVRQLEKLHNRAVEDRNYYTERMKDVKVSQKSKFNQLREILPPEFEWIKTKRRLLIETELQHHCVWSYADKISKDLCAIYSYVDSENKYSDDGMKRRYTIEFARDRKGKYSIVQIQGKYDKAHTKNMTDYVQSILNQAQKD